MSQLLYMNNPKLQSATPAKVMVDGSWFGKGTKQVGRKRIKKKKHEKTVLQTTNVKP